MSLKIHYLILQRGTTPIKLVRSDFFDHLQWASTSHVLETFIYNFWPIYELIEQKLQQVFSVWHYHFLFDKNCHSNLQTSSACSLCLTFDWAVLMSKLLSGSCAEEACLYINKRNGKIKNWKWHIWDYHFSGEYLEIRL